MVKLVVRTNPRKLLPREFLYDFADRKGLTLYPDDIGKLWTVPPEHPARVNWDNLSLDERLWVWGEYTLEKYMNDRFDADLTALVEQYGDEIVLTVADIPQGALYRISVDDDGSEVVQLRDEIKWSVA